MKSDSRVAILMCTFNGEKYLSEQLDSLMKQTYSNFVCYVHDDGSIDKTMQILEDYERKMKEKLVIVKYENRTHSANYNFCSFMKYAEKNLKEKYIMFCDQDDVWLPQKIEKTVCAVRNVELGETPALAYCDQIIVNEKLDVLYNSNEEIMHRTEADKSFKRIIFRNIAAGCCICINRPLLHLVCEAMEIQNVVMHDWWIMLVAQATGNVAFVPESLMLYRQHSANALGVDNKKYIIKTLKYLRHFRQSITERSEQTRKCIQQVYALNTIIDSCKQSDTIKMFCVAMNKNRASRISFISKEGYLSLDNFFTLLFV